MSIAPVPGPDPVTTGILTAGATLLKGLFNGGKNEGPNIARSLSQQVGFTVLQSDAATVRERLRLGLDPRTGVATQPGLTQRTTGIGGLFRGVLTGAISRGAGALGLPLTPRQVEDIINRPATGAPPPIALPPPVPLPTVSRDVLRTPARPRRMVPPVPPGGGKVSLLPATGMAGIGAVARMGARGLTRTSTGRISRIVLPSGQSFSRRSAANLIRRVGFEVAAVALGITAIEAAELLLTDSQTKRRGRGITAAQVRNARRTTCMVARLARDLGVKAAPVRRRKTCRS